LTIEPAASGLPVLHGIQRVMEVSAVALFSASSTWLCSRCCPALLFCSTNDLSAHDANALLASMTFCKTVYCFLT
jgi:hypothetical protein